jgi:hypothetical protein
MGLMLTEKANLTIASYFYQEKPDLKEIKKADLVGFKYQLDGGVYIPEKISWFGDLTGIVKAEDYILSKRGKKSLKKAQEFFQETGFKLDVREMNEELFGEFKKLYQKTTMRKERAIIFDLETSILGRIRVGKKCYIAGLYKENQLRSGLVFSINESSAVVSFGAKERFSKIRGGVGAILEYQLIKFALDHKLKSISHGRATNPAGLFNTAGLFEFKARYGFSAFPTGRWQTLFIKNDQIALGDLVFVTIYNNKLAYLVISDDDLSNLEKKYRTREVKNIVKVDKQSFYQDQKNNLNQIINNFS